MGQAAIPLMIASTAVSVVGQQRAASAQARAIENDAKRAEQQSQIQANEESLARKERLLQALSATAAGAGASGAGLAGSTYNIMTTDIAEFQKEQGRADLGATIQQSSIRQSARDQAKATRQSANISSGTSLLQLGTGLSYAGGPGVGTTSGPQHSPVKRVTLD